MPEALISIAAEHPAFAGHFPGSPVLPGVVLLDEALYQLARQRQLQLSACVLVSATFLAAVYPADVLTLEHALAGSGELRFGLRRGRERVLEGVLQPGSAA